MRALLKLLLNLPWWGSLLVVAGLVALFYLSGWWFRRRFDRIVREGVLEMGSALEGATVTVHAVEAVPMPADHSPYDIDKDDENFMEGVDDEPWNEDGVSYYAIDATIAPANDTGRWDPTALALVPADYAPADATEITERVCPLHSAEVFENGRFRTAPEKEVRGPQRLRMVFAVHDGLRSVKFGLFVTYFGHVDLPAPLPKTPAPRTGSSRR